MVYEADGLYERIPFPLPKEFERESLEKFQFLEHSSPHYFTSPHDSDVVCLEFIPREQRFSAHGKLGYENLSESVKEEINSKNIEIYEAIEITSRNLHVSAYMGHPNPADQIFPMDLEPGYMSFCASHCYIYPEQDKFNEELLELLFQPFLFEWSSKSEIKPYFEKKHGK